MKTIILVAMHKPYSIPFDGIYLPVYAGAHENNLAGYEEGRSGENISEENDKYCELTRAYWAWKNISCDYIGLCQYRRYFSGKFCLSYDAKAKLQCVLSKEQVEDYLKKYDIILPQKRRFVVETVESHFVHAYGSKPLELTRETLLKMDPEYQCAFDETMCCRSAHLNNMFVMPSDFFDSYCSWLFPLIFEIDQRLSAADVNQARLPAFIAERLMDVWVRKNRLHIKEVPILYLERQHLLQKAVRMLRRKFRRQ